MAKNMKWIVLALCLLLALGTLVLALAVFLPSYTSHTTMAGQGILHLSQDSSGKLTLSWDEAKGADCYCLEILLAQQDGEEQVIHREYIWGSTQCVLPTLPQDQSLTLRISSVAMYSVFGEERLRFGDSPISVTGNFSVPTVTDLSVETSPDDNQVTLSYTMQQGDFVRMYLVQEDGTYTLLKTLQGQQVELLFGADGDLPMPESGKPCRLVFDAYRLSPGIEIAGAISAEVTVAHEDLLGRDLKLKLTDEGQNVCSLTWVETKGEYYELQMRQKDNPRWTVVGTYQPGEELKYVSSHLSARNVYQFRVVAVGGETMEGSEYAAESEIVSFKTTVSPIYCTVWPVKELDAYSDAQKTQKAGTVSLGKAYCVLEEEDGMFGIRLNGQLCYIDSNYCMINLPEYLGDLCKYNITNSYSSIFMVHEFDIPEVTDEVLPGYEYVLMENGEFLAPLLYPTAQKLYAAAQAAIDEGYRLKIYESFRPRKTTTSVYSLTESILDDPIPEEPHTNRDVSADLEALRVSLGLTEESQITYSQLMTNNKWSLSYFLARGRSYHNLGIAVDLTLERLDTDEELEMQTAIHDLSFYSVLGSNNDNADLLSEIMTGVGLGGLISEWWHFQDNEIYKSLDLVAVEDGVSPECWMADDTGWRYRQANGLYASSCTMRIDGQSYTFDADGYVVS